MRADRSWLRLLVVGVLGWLLFGARANAEPRTRERVFVLSERWVPARLRAEIEHALARRYTLSKGQGASSSAALRAQLREVERAGADLLIVVSTHGRALRLRFIDPHTPRVLGESSLWPPRSRNSAWARGRVLAQTARYLEALARSDHGRPRPARLDEEQDEAQDEGDLAIASDEPARRRSDPVATDEDDEVQDDDEEQADDEVQADFAEEPSDDAEPSRPLTVAFQAGLGSSTRGVGLMARDSRARLDTGLALALDVGVQLCAAADLGFAWVASARYQTSVGLEVAEPHVNGPAQKMGLRVHRFEAGLGARLALGDGGMTLTPSMGFALRSIAPELHYLLTPFYTLAGPYARAEFALPLLRDTFGLRVAPELHWLSIASAVAGGSGPSGLRFAFGAELTLFFQLAKRWDLELAVRESHAWVQSGTSQLTDVERFGIARAVWRP